MNNQEEEKYYIEEVERWLSNVVIGLNLCPFAKAPYRKKNIRYHVLLSDNVDDLLIHFEAQLGKLMQTEASILETTLIITPNMLSSFDDYLENVRLAEWSLKQWGLSSSFQIATFHPDYCFEGQAKDDLENLTNRAPFPIIHLLRQESLNKMLSEYPSPEQIPENNMQRMREMSEEERKRLFYYLLS